MQDITHSLNPGAPEVLHSQSLPKSMVLKNGLFYGSDSSHDSDHLQSQAAISGSGWYRQLMTSNTEKVIRKNSTQHPSTCTGKRLKSTHLAKEGQKVSELFLHD